MNGYPFKSDKLCNMRNVSNFGECLFLISNKCGETLAETKEMLTTVGNFGGKI